MEEKPKVKAIPPEEKADLPKHYIYCGIHVTDFGNLLHLWQEEKYKKKGCRFSGIIWISRQDLIYMHPIYLADLLRKHGFRTFGPRTIKSIERLQEKLRKHRYHG